MGRCAMRYGSCTVLARFTLPTDRCHKLHTSDALDLNAMPEKRWCHACLFLQNRVRAARWLCQPAAL